MAYADKIFQNNLKRVLKKGVWDTGYKVRPKWSDGEPAHTLYTGVIFNEYDIADKGFPITTLRPVAWKTGLKELLWIYQDKSNDVNFLKEKYGVNYWDSWANEEGNLGLAYGAQMAKVIDFPEGTFTQLDRVIYLLKNDPMNRRIATEMLNLEEMKKMTLAPCAHATEWLVRGEYLDMKLDQRSNDMIAAQSINVSQYALLLMMIAQVTGYKAGKLYHVITNMHIYDRHIDMAKKLLKRKTYKQPLLLINPEIKNFYDFTPDDFKLINYKTGEQIKNIPIAI